MKKILLSAIALFVASIQVNAEMLIDGTKYDVDTLIRKEIGPGVTYTRIRIPKFPLNVNTITMDLTNPYNRIETTVGQEVLGSTETLANAYKRQSVEGKQPLAAANANFWCTTEKPYTDYIRGTTFGGNLRNGKILTETNMYSNQWVGGAERTGVVSIDTNKKLWIESMSWKGYAKCAKWTTSPEIIQINKMCNENELVMFNSYYGKSRKFNTTSANTEVFLTLNDGATWGVNKDISATVKEIKLNSGGNTLGEYDICLSATGGYKTMLEQLAVGDVVSVNYAWTSLKTQDTPNIEQLVAGNAIVLKNGELTERNTDEGYNSQIYSRTGYGMSKDGKTLYVIVIDKSTDPIYGISAGCGTNVMAQILQQVGCWNLCSMDAGGSAQMMIQGEVINKTTEGTPRAVANGLMFYSIAPKEKEIAKIRFADFNLKSPVYSSYTPRIYGYNKYGDLIDEDLKGVKLSCDANIGTTEGGTFNATGVETVGNLTATYNGVSVTEKIKIMNANIALRVKPILIDNVKEYPIEVTAKINDIEYKYNPAHLTWTVENSAIASIDNNGVLRGLKEGTTTITCTIGEFTDNTTVKVEIPTGTKMAQGYDGWKLTSAVAKNLVLSGEGVLSMNYNGGRGANIKMVKDIAFYSLPKKIMLDFTSTLPITYIQIDYRPAKKTSTNYVNFGKDSGGYKIGTRYQVELPISELGDPNDMILYPINLKNITFYIATEATTGANNITIHGLYAEYPDGSGVENIMGSIGNDVRVYPNPIVDGSMNISAGDAQSANVTIFNQAGSAVWTSNVILNGGSAAVDVSHVMQGLYFVKIATDKNNTIKKIIIK
ncbi:MAG: phosphodiester glycosidase family protein [Muribaculaceae bacterium]